MIFKSHQINIDSICTTHIPKWIKEAKQYGVINNIKFKTYKYSVSGRNYVRLNIISDSKWFSLSIDYFCNCKFVEMLNNICLIKLTFNIIGGIIIVDEIDRTLWLCGDCGDYIEIHRGCKECIEKENRREKQVEKLEKEEQKRNVWLKKLEEKETALNNLVYLIECNGVYKIGITGNLKKRIVSIKTSTPYKINIIATSNNINKQSSISLEKKLHKKYNKTKISGEWFGLNKDEVNNIVVELKKYV